MTRLQIIQNIMGVQGGTIHQANFEVKTCLDIPDEEFSCLLTLSDWEFDEIAQRFKNSYQKWISFHAEQERE